MQWHLAEEYRALIAFMGNKQHLSKGSRNLKQHCIWILRLLLFLHFTIPFYKFCTIFVSFKRPNDLKQNATHKEKIFLGLVFVAFHVVCILLQVLAQETTFWMVEILQKPITLSQASFSRVFVAFTHNRAWKTESDNAFFSFVSLFLFEVTWAFGKMSKWIQWV